MYKLDHEIQRCFKNCRAMLVARGMNVLDKTRRMLSTLKKEHLLNIFLEIHLIVENDSIFVEFTCYIMV